jgi:hypothetical protein
LDFSATNPSEASSTFSKKLSDPHTDTDFPNMALNDLVQPVAAAVTSQVKLCPYDEEEPHIWFRLIEAQFAAAGIKSQKLKYANALTSLPKQVLRDILDTLDVCIDSDHPFDLLKTVLLRQFGKSRWQSYFELLRLPMTDMIPDGQEGRLEDRHASDGQS